MDHSSPPAGPALRFAPGRLLTTPGALETLRRYRIDPLTLLQRHLSGDWGDTCSEDAEANEQALRHALRIVSVYQLVPPTEEPDLGSATVWVITEADRVRREVA